jgi:hypothetical protein
MPIKTASTGPFDIDGIIKAIDQPNVKAVIYFFSVELESLQPQRKFKQAFPRASCIGASMLGGWCPAGPVDKGIVAMSLSDEEVEEVFFAFREGVKDQPATTARGIIADLKRKISRPTDPDGYLGIILPIGLCLVEQIMHEFLIDKDMNMIFAGGAAADELTFTKTLVGCDEKLSDNAVAVIVMKMRIPFFCEHYVHHIPTNHSFTITKAETKRRLIWEINGEPAAPYFAKLIGLRKVEDITFPIFASNPIGIVIGDTVYARSGIAVMEGTALKCDCYIEAGAKACLLKQGDIIDHAQRALQKANRYLPHVQGAILFNCALRYIELKDTNKVQAFNNVFGNLPFIGFNCYGEELFTHHNQTLTAVFLGSC